MHETHFNWCVGLSPVPLCYLIQKRSLATLVHRPSLTLGADQNKTGPGWEEFTVHWSHRGQEACGPQMRPMERGLTGRAIEAHIAFGDGGGESTRAKRARDQWPQGLPADGKH